MSIALGVAASHTTLMNTHWDALTHVDRAVRFRDALGVAREQIAAARPDVALIIGSNHFRGFYLDLVPAFTLGVGECIASGESGTPGGPQRVDVPFARDLAERLLAEGFDVAFSAEMQVDHGITHAIQYLLAELHLPIVPLVVNVFAPPLPTIARCAQLGAALGRAIAERTDRRVVAIASGGLSHTLPWPDWRAPQDEDDAFLVEAFTYGRERWREYEARRREIVLKASAAAGDRFAINEAFDRRFLAALEAGTLAGVVADAHALDDAGNGGQEIRTWILLSAALQHRAGRVLAYEPIPEWLTGMGVATIPTS